MSGSDRDLVVALRAELAAIDPGRPCDRRAEALGLAGMTSIREGFVARLFLRLAPERAALRPGSKAALTAMAPVRLADFDWDGSAEHCRLAWLRGLFLARGSLSLAGGRFHLEFVVDADEGPLLADRLRAMTLPAAWRIRRGRGVVTWKNGERVGTFLRRIGASATLLEVEARQVSRALRGDLNRVINAESANLHRAVGAAGRQLAAIDELAASGELSRQPAVVRAVAAARRETPEASLGELAERLEIHRSAAQRALERIERLASQPAEGPGGGRRLGRDPDGSRPASAPPDSPPLA